MLSCLVKGFTFENPNLNINNDHNFTMKNPVAEIVCDDAE